MSHAHVEGIGGRELELWFMRLRKARQQYRQAAAKLRTLQGASSVSEPPNNSDLLAACEAESSALAEYQRVLAVFTALVEKRKRS